MMKEIIVSILLVLGSQILAAHGGHIATYKYQVTPKSITLEFQIENSVIDHFNLENQCPTFKTATAFCLAQYINSKNTLNINSSNIQFELQSSRRGEDFFIIKMRAKGDFLNCEKITLENDCFLEFDRKFENRIIIEKEGSVKSYLLNFENINIRIG